MRNSKKPYRIFCFSVLVQLVLLVLMSKSSYAQEFEKHSFSIATFNLEFLTRKKIHVKYGAPFFLNPGDANREDLVESLLIQGDDSERRNFLKQYDADVDYQNSIHKWGDSAFRDARLEESLRKLSAYISTIDADVLVLTEIGYKHSEFERLQDYLKQDGQNYAYQAMCKCWDGFTEQGVAVLSKTPLIDVAQSLYGSKRYYFELDDEVAEKRTKLSKAMRVKFESGGQPFYLFAAHLKSELGGHESDAQRIAQGSILRRHAVELIDKCESDDSAQIVNRSAEGECPVGSRPVHVLIVGDLNDHRGQPAIRMIRGFDDLYPDFLQTGKKEYFDESEWGERWTKEHEGMLNQIDHVLVSESVLEINRSIGTGGRVKLQSKIMENNDPAVSDHRPLLVQFSFSKASSD